MDIKYDLFFNQIIFILSYYIILINDIIEFIKIKCNFYKP